MKFLICFALALATVTPKDFYFRLIEDPVPENEGRIVNGQKADPAQFKYMVGLNFQRISSTYWCGGSLIGDKWVLSAAHCAQGALSVKVYLGATKRNCPEKSYNVPEDDILIHPLWNLMHVKNDISLIQIPATNETSRIAFVKIPNNNIKKYLNKSVIVSGWGQTSENGTTRAINLRYAILKVSPAEICLERYTFSFSDDNRICVATPHEVSTCKGDSGGPLVLEKENIQIGVNSYGGRSCTNKEPIVFTRVSAYRLWIFLRIGSRS